MDPILCNTNLLNSVYIYTEESLQKPVNKKEQLNNTKYSLLRRKFNEKLVNYEADGYSTLYNNEWYLCCNFKYQKNIPSHFIYPTSLIIAS